jgi:mono/diheme cytochrome c family protein
MRPFRAPRLSGGSRAASPAAALGGATLLALCVVAAVHPLRAQGGPYERQKVDPAAARRGAAVYNQHCINCHGSTAKGTDKGPDLIRSVVVLRDRLGILIGPAAQRPPAHQATLTAVEITDLSHFLHQRVELTATNRNARGPIDVLTGDPEAGRAFFHGEGGCSGCHSTTGDLAGLAKRIPNGVTLQQRWLFPSLSRDGGRRVEVVVTSGGRTVQGALVRMDDFNVSLRDASGDYMTIPRLPGVQVEVHDPLAAHQALLDRYTDGNMHDMTTYLSTLQ